MTNGELMVMSVSHDASQYCLGLMQAVKNNFKELNGALAAKWKKGSVWRMSKVVFAQEKTSYVSAMCKLAADVRKSPPQIDLDGAAGRTLTDASCPRTHRQGEKSRCHQRSRQPTIRFDTLAVHERCAIPCDEQRLAGNRGHHFVR